MGGAVSRNVVNTTIEAISSVATNISTRSDITSSASQVISVRNVGDLIISGIVQRIEVNINIDSLMDTMSDVTAQQDIISNLTQASKSLVSGINLFQFASATNEMRSMIKATLTISTEISLHCEALSNTSQAIIVEQVARRVQITDVTQTSMVNLLSQCTQQVISDVTSVQSLQQTIDQSASAEARGLDITIMAIMIAVVVVVVVIAGAAGGITIVNKIFLFVFIAMLAVGSILIIIAQTTASPYVSVKPFSILISNTPTCGAGLLDERDDIDDPTAAGSICLDDDECLAFDWESVRINADGTPNLLPSALTRFYSSLSNNPCAEIMERNDTQRLAYDPRYTVFRGGSSELPDINDPLVFIDDVALSNDTLQIYVLEEGPTGARWVLRDHTLTKEPVANPPYPGTLFVDQESPQASDGDPEDLWLEVSNPAVWRLWTKPASGAWTVLNEDIQGSGYAIRTGCEEYLTEGQDFVFTDTSTGPDTSTSDQELMASYCMNVSGFFDPGKNTTLLYVGIALLIVGVIGLGYTIAMRVLDIKAKRRGIKGEGKTEISRGIDKIRKTIEAEKSSGAAAAPAVPNSP